MRRLKIKVILKRIKDCSVNQNPIITQSHKAHEERPESDQELLRVFVPSCEIAFLICEIREICGLKIVK